MLFRRDSICCAIFIFAQHCVNLFALNPSFIYEKKPLSYNGSKRERFRDTFFFYATKPLILTVPHPHLQRHLRPLLLLHLPVPLGDGVVEELVDAVDDVGADEGEAAEAAAVHDADRQRGAVDLLRLAFVMHGHGQVIIELIEISIGKKCWGRKKFGFLDTVEGIISSDGTEPGSDSQTRSPIKGYCRTRKGSSLALYVYDSQA